MKHAKIKIKVPKLDIKDALESDVLDIRDAVAKDLQKVNKARAKLGAQMATIQKVLAGNRAKRSDT